MPLYKFKVLILNTNFFYSKDNVLRTYEAIVRRNWKGCKNKLKNSTKKLPL